MLSNPSLCLRIMIKQDLAHWLPLDCPLFDGHGNVTARETFQAHIIVEAYTRSLPSLLLTVPWFNDRGWKKLGQKGSFNSHRPSWSGSLVSLVAIEETKCPRMNDCVAMKPDETWSRTCLADTWLVNAAPWGIAKALGRYAVRSAPPSLESHAKKGSLSDWENCIEIDRTGWIDIQQKLIWTNNRK